MQLTKLSDSELFLKLGEIAAINNIKLRFAHKQFYVLLLHFCEKHGERDTENGQYFIQLSVSKLSKEFNISTSIVQQALKLLSDCNVVRRESLRRDFHKLSSKSYVSNSPYRTYLILPL